MRLFQKITPLCASVTLAVASIVSTVALSVAFSQDNGIEDGILLAANLQDEDEKTPDAVPDVVESVVEDPIEPPIPTIEPAGPSSSMGNLLFTRLGDLPPDRAAGVGDPTASLVSGAESTVLGTTDTGDLLTSSVFNTGVFSRQLSPVMTDTRVRGYRYAQIRTTLDGSAWFAVRPDLDTPLSRFDSNIVKDVLVIRGPYNVRLGPGFSFIDVTLRDTPRSEYGTIVNGVTKFSWDTNGEQWYGRQSFFGGNAESGWRIGYGHRGGEDFRAGDGSPLASGYESRDWDFALGYDLTPDSSLEFTYIRTDMTDVDLPGQVNDLRVLTSDGFNVRFVIEDQCYFDRFTVRGWYNIAEYDGTLANKNSDAPTNPDLFFDPASIANPPGMFEGTGRLERVTTFGNTSSTGYRTAMSWGDVEFSAFTVGADLTFYRQTYLERRDNGVVDFGVPSSLQKDAGIFVDGTHAVTDRLTLKAGGRVDFVNSDADPTSTVDARDIGLQNGMTATCVQFNLPCVGPLPTRQRYNLGAAYLSAQYELDRELTLNGGVGYAERAPSPTDLYGDLPHLSIMQEGAFFIPHGNLLLAKEKALQVDLGLTMKYDRFRGGVSVFYSEVDDFITYDAPHLKDRGPHDQHAIGVNHDTRMAGGEFYGEFDISEPLTAFATLSYVQAKDRVLDEPLWGIAPLDTRIGLRLQDTCCETPRWGVEYILRLVDDQDRLSSVGFAGEQRTPGFNTHSIRGYYLVNDDVTFIAGVENIGDAFYREHLDTRTDLTSGIADPSRGVVRRGVSFYFALQAAY